MLLLMFFISTLIHAQLVTYHCATDSSFFVPKALDCTPNSDAWINTYRLQESYVPKSINPWVGQKTIPVNIIFFGEDNGTGFPLTPTQFDSLRPLLQHWMNENFQSVVSPTGVVPFCNDYLNDSKIRVEIKNARFIPNSSVLNDSSFQQLNTTVNNHLILYPYDGLQLNWYIIKKHYHYKPIYTQNATGSAQTYIFNGNSGFSIVTGSSYYQYGFEWIDGFQRFSNHFPHEIGHHFSLNHLYGEETLPTNNDYLCDVFPLGINFLIPGTNNNLMGAGGANNWLSPLQMGRAHRTLILNEMRHFAYGYNPSPIEITSDQTWDFTFKSYNDIVVKSGKTLTITCRLEMVKEASIIVEPGARLVVDGGTITSARSAGPDYEGLWQGIKLHGNSNAAQTLQPNGYYPQAHLIMKNGAVVENARNAVTNWKYNDYTKTGGLIQASNSTFRNNGCSVEFVAYDFPEKSTFIECSFIMDDTLKDGSLPSSMVTMWGVNGTRFIGCNFECKTNVPLAPFDRPKGIYTIGAGFSVIPKCSQNPPQPGPCPSQYATPSAFKGLSTGIHATNGLMNTFKVERAIFDTCHYGITTSRVNNFSITKTVFNVPNYFQTGTGVGLANEYGTGFIIQENLFNGAGNNQGFLIGAFSNETGVAANQIYKNTFKNLPYANFTNGINWAYNQSDKGLEFKCNTFESNNSDIIIMGGTVAQNQGKVISLGNGQYEFQPAQNTFSTTINPAGHIGNYGNNHIYYIYSNDIPSLQYEPTHRTLNNVSAYEASGVYINKQCTTKLIPINLFPSPGQTAGFFQKKAAYNEASYTYANYIDGGNTTSLLNQINQSWPNEALALRNELLEKSPFVSMDVLYNLADKPEIIPHALMLDVFIANPHCSRDENFIHHLLSKAYPMPLYMVEILQGDTTTTLKDQIESEMSYYASELAEIANFNIHYYQTDSLNASIDSVNIWIQRKADYGASLQLADNAGNLTQYGLALNQLDNLKNNNPYLPKELIPELDSREDLWIKLAAFQNGNASFWKLDSSQQMQLNLFALSGKKAGHTEAMNILEFFYGYTFERPIDMQSEIKTKKDKDLLVTENKKNEVSMYPNPAGDYVIIDFSQTDVVPTGLTIQLFDAQGRSVMNQILNKTFQTIDISNLNSGTYFYKIQSRLDGNIFNGTIVKK